MQRRKPKEEESNLPNVLVVDDGTRLGVPIFVSHVTDLLF